MSDPVSRSLFERAERVIPGGVNSPVRAFRAVGGEPVFVARAAGSRIWYVGVGTDGIEVVAGISGASLACGATASTLGGCTIVGAAIGLLATGAEATGLDFTGGAATTAGCSPRARATACAIVTSVSPTGARSCLAAGARPPNTWCAASTRSSISPIASRVRAAFVASVGR